jgi:tRNA nucleotidyltransferase (CCA-adding enzyme)
MQLVLGADAAMTIRQIAEVAQAAGQALYLVGGCVRDLLLRRRNLDLDFVVEGDAIALARRIAAAYGGEVSAYPPFGTATWKLTDGVASKLCVQAVALPDHIDFVTARNEYYETPTALPTVYSGSIKLDLARRDFTINTLAVQLSPPPASGRLLDPFQGVRDLQAKVIRVLHNLSFVDDPTRILRAYRFSHRLGFQIESRTDSLIDTALPMLARITGERLRNEFRLLLQEERPELALLTLQGRGILKAIHPALTVPPKLARQFEQARDTQLPWQGANFTLLDLYWHIMASHWQGEALQAVCERLLVPAGEAESWRAARELVESTDWLGSASVRPSEIVERLGDLPESALLAGWFLLESPAARGRIGRFWHEWRHIKPSVDGHYLRQIGLKPGPCYSLILRRLRNGLLDGELQSGADEQASVTQWITEGLCDETAS